MFPIEAITSSILHLISAEALPTHNVDNLERTLCQAHYKSRAPPKQTRRTVAADLQAAYLLLARLFTQGKL